MTSIEQKDQTDQEDLRQIEAELTDVLDKEKRNWTKIYELMSRVEREKLYEQKENCRSFTQSATNNVLLDHATEICMSVSDRLLLSHQSSPFLAHIMESVYI